MKKNLLAFVCAMSVTCAFSQDLSPGFKFWESVGLEWEINKKLSLKFNEMLAFNTRKGNILQFGQADFGVNYRPSKLVELAVGYKPSVFSLSGGTTLYSRVYNDVMLRHKLFTLPVKHTITSEFFFPSLPKYQYRFSYSMNYYFKNKFLPFKMTPYIKGEMYYYLGGSKNTYYDGLGNKIVKQRPNDFHRYRIGGGITSKPLPYLRATIYYLHQQEFNTNLTKNRGINVPNKDGTIIRDPFNNYNVIGLELEFTIKSKDRVKSKEKVKTFQNEY